MDIERIEAARRRIAGYVRHTPLEPSRALSTDYGCEVHLKLECLQLTGAFKLRGALARISTLTDAEKRRGILAVSAGNHGLAVAHCAEMLGLDATIVVPRSASRAKVDGMRRYPITVLELGAHYDEAEQESRRLERETGKTFVSPYNDPEVVAGQGTLGLELLEDLPQVEAVVVPVGGGGLLAGVALAIKARRPAVHVYGAEPVTTPTLTCSLEAGEIVTVDEEPTIADGCAGNIEPGSCTFPIMRQHVDGVICVGERAIREAMRRVAMQHRLILEGAGAVAVAALDDPRLKGKRVAAVLSGRNIELGTFLKAVGANE